MIVNKTESKDVKNCLYIKMWLCCGVLLLSFILIFGRNVYASDHYSVVTHKGVKEESISENLLRSIFSMRATNWSNGKLIKVFVFPDEHELHQDFAKEQLNVFPYQLRLAWDRLVFSGTGQAPIRVNSSKEMLERIVNTPGAIGYLRISDINDDVRVLKIR